MKASIVLIGSGNVATHLGKRLVEKNHQILQIWSRTLKNADILASELKAHAISSWDELNLDADFYIISVKDQAIVEVAQELQSRIKKGIILHTSGSTDMDALKGCNHQPYGVLYPLQTFSKQKEIDFSNIPIAYETSDCQSLLHVENLARSVSEKSFFATSKQRLALHVSAVFACNFTNYFYSIAENILIKNDLNFDLIKPLIQETTEKALKFSPSTVQTGPAIRRDTMILEKHSIFLQESPVISNLYTDISRLIMKIDSNDGSKN